MRYLIACPIIPLAAIAIICWAVDRVYGPPRPPRRPPYPGRHGKS